MSTSSSSGIGRQIAVSAAFMVALRFAFRAIGIISTLILVRLLGPAEFGIVGLAMVTFAVLETVSDLSFEKALIRMPNPEPAHFDTAWTLGIFRGLLIALILVAAGPLLADFVDEPNVVPICYAIAIIAVGQSFQNNGMVNYQRDFRFDKIFKFQLIAKLIGVVATLAAAFILRNFWALVIGTAVAKLVLVPLSYGMHPYRPKFSLKVWKDLFHFSKWLLVSNVQVMVENYSMVLVLGRIGGPTAIGLFQVANEFGTLPATEVAAPIRQPLYVGYSRHANDMAAFRNQYIGGLALTLTLLIPASIGIALMSEPITQLVLGGKWIGAQPILALCALYGVFEATSHYTNDVFLALHRQARFAWLYTIAIMVRLPAILIGAYLGGVEGAVIGLLISAAFNAIFLNIHIGKLTGLRIGDFARAAWRSLVAVSIMAACVWLLNSAWISPADTLTAWIRMFAISGFGAVIHLSVLFALWRVSGSPAGPEAQMLKVLRKGFEKLTSRTADKVPDKA